MSTGVLEALDDPLVVVTKTVKNGWVRVHNTDHLWCFLFWRYPPIARLQFKLSWFNISRIQSLLVLRYSFFWTLLLLCRKRVAACSRCFEPNSGLCGSQTIRFPNGLPSVSLNAAASFGWGQLRHVTFKSIFQNFSAKEWHFCLVFKPGLAAASVKLF